MNVSELLVRCLENEGVQYVFGVPGEENLDFMEALSHSSQITFVLARDERGAAFMADVYGRLAGAPGVCLATLGPGASNLVTGLADATLDGSPVVAITGQLGLPALHKESHQLLDVQALMDPVTKWGARIDLAETVPEIVRTAFRVARLEKPGATHIELPEDVAVEPAAGEPLPVRRTTYPAARADTVERAAEVLRAAERPVVLCGNGVIRRRAAEALVAFAQTLRVPVVPTFMAKGVLDDRDELALPAEGLRGAADGPLRDADVVIAVGYDLIEWSPEYWNGDGHAQIVHVDSRPAPVDRDYLPAVEVVGEIRDSLSALAQAMGDWRARTETERYREPYLRADAAAASDDAFPLHPARVMHGLREVMDEADVLISDVGVHKLWIAKRFRAWRENTVLIGNGLASMGIALPGAIGARLALGPGPSPHIIAVSGDGGFLTNVQELETARRLGTSFVAVVLVDDRLGLIDINQRRKFGHSFAVDFGNPDFVRLAEAFDVPAFAVGAAAELVPTLRRALDTTGPSLVAVPVRTERPEAPAG